MFGEVFWYQQFLFSTWGKSSKLRKNPDQTTTTLLLIGGVSNSWNFTMSADRNWSSIWIDIYIIVTTYNWYNLQSVNSPFHHVSQYVNHKWILSTVWHLFLVWLKYRKNLYLIRDNNTYHPFHEKNQPNSSETSIYFRLKVIGVLWAWGHWGSIFSLFACCWMSSPGLPVVGSLPGKCPVSLKLQSINSGLGDWESWILTKWQNGKMMGKNEVNIQGGLKYDSFFRFLQAVMFFSRVPGMLPFATLGLQHLTARWVWRTAIYSPLIYTLGVGSCISWSW